MNSNRLKAQGSMMSAVACASVPKITVVIGGCHGADSYAMVRDTADITDGLWYNELYFICVHFHLLKLQY